MNNIAGIHSRLTANNLIEDSKPLIMEFAKELGWNPSYFIEPSAVEKSNGYLVIEHGLQNSAILSFLKERNEDLTQLEEENLLGLSYNNLVNWHITIDSRYINYYFILNKERKKVETRKIEVGNEEEALSVDTFYEIIGKKQNSNIKALDDVLIENISNWKRIISAELDNQIDLISLSHLFNCVIFLRSIEDGKKRSNELNNSSKLFLDILNNSPNSNLTQVIEAVESELSINVPDFILDKKRIAPFNSININLNRFFNSFYENEYNRFKYDFSIMTKQALSRIYQRYVSILSIVNSSNQLEAFPAIPIERINKENGSYYTPEYIARFFSKYIYKSYTDKEYDALSVLEPAVGSGIFLRTLLETQIDRRISNDTILDVNDLFNNVWGIDIDPNACLSTNLSLTLLHYIFNKNFPRPNIIHGDSLEIMSEYIEAGKKFDIVISNPPYINQDNKGFIIIDKYKNILEGLVNGKIDIYQAFIKLSIDILNPNGLGLFVLPYNFLIGESSKKLRNYLLDQCNVEFVADLSAINVFDKVSTYVILIGFRKKSNTVDQDRKTWLLKCRTSVGDALNQLLIENESEQKQFQVYKVQDYFKKDGDWFLLNRTEYNLLNKLQKNVSLDNFLRINQGVITGNDPIYIRDASEVSKSERSIYKLFLPDKEIEKFSVEKKPTKLLFYPFINNKLIAEKTLIEEFPETWEYLKLSLSKEIPSKPLWWNLHRARNPQYLSSPKIVAPYMSITPKFSLDKEGQFITSRSPFFVLKQKDNDPDLLYYFLGILNSAPCYWALSLKAQKQSSGYNIFHISVLNTAPIPDPTLSSNSSLVFKMISTVKKRIKEKNLSKQFDLEYEINKIACDLYQLDPHEMEVLGV